MIDKPGKIIYKFPRLWGEGQILICHSRIISFGADGAATETLKNLVLAGCGYIALVDNKIIDEDDLRENFFLNKDDIGKNRAQVALQNLLELNPDDTQGIFYDATPEDFIIHQTLQLQTFDLILSTNKLDV
jgi:amyloid beta precursor protein binding protein 1